jgi:hypothetical protein
LPLKVIQVSRYHPLSEACVVILPRCPQW